jgi:hypothetical protein
VFHAGADHVDKLCQRLWGDFKGNEDAWMEKYFDAFLYFANWGTHVLKLGLPSRLLDLKTAKEYCPGDSAVVREKSGRVILSFVYEDDEGSDWDEDEVDLSSMISVRSELARGDLRALYLAWLLCAESGELDEDEVEPAVPPGLGQLSASLKSLAEFLRIGDDLLHVAAQCSPTLNDSGPAREDVLAWVTGLPSSEKDEIITDLVVDRDRTFASELLQKFLKERSHSPRVASVLRRTVGELLTAAEVLIEERLRIDAEKRAAQKARQERETAIARDKHLDSLAGKEAKLWDTVETLITTKQPKSYDEAMRLLVDMRDLDARIDGGDFRMRIESLRQTHARKPTFIERLNKAGL